MVIPESQLETWAHQGAIVTSKQTYASVKGALESRSSAYSEQKFEIFLQGSYCNDTNVRADRDVDVVIMLTSIFRSDVTKLSVMERIEYERNYSNATYSLEHFRQGVLAQLRSVFGSVVRPGNKAVTILPGPGRLGADVLVCNQYRDYRYFRDESDEGYAEGVLFHHSNGEEIVNYPKLHSANCTQKHQRTGSRFKPTVRLLKNMRNRLIGEGLIDEGIAPSYFIEGMLFNVPDSEFAGDLEDRFVCAVNWLSNVDRSRFLCANEKQRLFGQSSVSWNEGDCALFLGAVIDLWNQW